MTLVLNDEEILKMLDRNSQEIEEIADLEVAKGHDQSLVDNKSAEPNESVEPSVEEIEFLGLVTPHVASEVMNGDKTRAQDAKKKSSKGRPRHPINSEFIWLQSGRVQCPDCLQTVTGRVDVMKNHKKACRGLHKRPSTSLQAATEFQVETTPPAEPKQSISVLIPTPSVTKRSAPKRIFDNWEEAPLSKKPLRAFVDDMTEKEKQKLHLQCGKFFYACNLPFRIVKNDEFIEFLKMLRPSYRPPGEKEIGDGILNRVYEEVGDSLKNVLENKEVVLMQDGWSTSQTEPVIAHSIHSGNQVHFINAISTGTSSKTAQYCLDLLDATIKACESEYKCKIVGVVTDNCNVMTNFRTLVQEKYKSIIAYGCTSHYLNSIGRKVTPADKIEDIVKIQKYFKNHHFQSASLLARKGKRPIIPGSTRWNSQQDCLENFLENHTHYLDILRKNKEKFTGEISKLIKRGDIYEEAQLILDTAKPIAIALDKSQGNSFTISQAVAEMVTLRQTLRLSPDENEYFHKKINEAMISPVISAYIMDPRFRGQGLTSHEIERGYQWLETQDKELPTLAMELEAKNEEKFPRYLMNEDVMRSTDPRTFWSVVQNRTDFPPAACQIAQKLMKLPASASGIERCFSTMSSILSRNRNKLGIEKAGKLCTIYRSLRCLKDED